MANFDRDLRKKLEASGCTFVREGKGSHQIWHSPITNINFAVPLGTSSRHTVNAVLKQAGIQEKF
jgi:predicted RNA binding protein YcfA (HicA-like mRNA interferase family)